MATVAPMNDDASKRASRYMFQAPAELTAFVPGMMVKFSILNVPLKVGSL